MHLPVPTLAAVLAILLGSMTPGLTHAQQILIASINEDIPRLIVSQNIMSHIYQRLGHTMTIANYPAKRSLVEVNNGSADGELARSSMIEASNPNLIRIPYAIGTIKLVVIHTKNTPQITQLAQLKNYRIGIMRGLVATDKISEQFPREMYNDITALFKGLINDRVDVILFTKFGAEHYLQELKLQDQLVISDKLLLEIPLYHYLHQRSKDIAQALKAEMHKMHTTGELQTLINTQEQRFMESNAK
ncbi:MAG: transporter substrate-binding domain-containing protein [Oleispira sp.]|nr:transporter substrate-binding domain-containing protein [Oleispira sp.]